VSLLELGYFLIKIIAGSSETNAPRRTNPGVKHSTLKSASEMRERRDMNTTVAKKYASRAGR
jgi:hypothetical protein